MRKPFPFLFLPFLLLFNCATTVKQDDVFSLVKTIPLPGVNGRIDHIAVDEENKNIYIAAVGNDDLVMLYDYLGRCRYTCLPGFHEPQGVLYLAGKHVIAVANGGNGEVDFYSADSLKKMSAVQTGDDADNMRYDSIAKKIYVGYGSGGIAVIDEKTFLKTGAIRLPAHPESFQIDSGSHRMYVNIPGAHKVDVIDLDSLKVVAEWKMEKAHANFPMALDAADHRLFVGCRRPAQLEVMDTQTGKIIASLDCDDDADDIFYNSEKKEIYVSCGAGYIDVFKQDDADRYELVSKTTTRSGARTSLFVPAWNQLLVAVPASGKDPAELRIYTVK